MTWRDRSGGCVPGDAGQDRLLEWMYGTAFGRLLVKIMIRPGVSRAAGWLLADLCAGGKALYPRKPYLHG